MLGDIYREIYTLEKISVVLGDEFAICELSSQFAVGMQIYGLGQPSGRSSIRDLPPLGSPPGGRL